MTMTTTITLSTTTKLFYMDLRAEVSATGAVTFSYHDGSGWVAYGGEVLVVEDGGFTDLMTFLDVVWATSSSASVLCSATIVKTGSGRTWSQHQIGPVDFVDDIASYSVGIIVGSTVTWLAVRVEQRAAAVITPEDIVIDPGDPVPDPGTPPPPPPGGRLPDGLVANTAARLDYIFATLVNEAIRGRKDAAAEQLRLFSRMRMAQTEALLESLPISRRAEQLRGDAPGNPRQDDPRQRD